MTDPVYVTREMLAAALDAHMNDFHEQPESFDSTAAVADNLYRHLAALSQPEPGAGLDDHENEPHEFTTVCRRCGKPGMLHVSLITSDERVAIQPAAEYDRLSREP